MPRNYLLSTPGGLKALQARHTSSALQGPDGFISTEVVFRDARAAHHLHALLRELYQASAAVHDQARIHGRKPTAAQLATLAGALKATREWL